MAILGASVGVAASQRIDSGRQFLWLAAFDVVTLLVLRLRGIYRFRLQASALDEVGAIVAGTAIAGAGVVTFRSVMQPSLQTGPETLLTWLLVTAALLAVRVGVRLAGGGKRDSNSANTLIIGAGAVGRGIARRLLERPDLGLRPVGFLDKDPLLHMDTCDLPVLGSSWNLEEQAALHQVRTVVVTFSTAPHHVYLSLMRRCHALGLEVLVVPRLFEEIAGRVKVAHVGAMPLMQVEPVRHRSWPITLKYLLDRVVAALALVVLAPTLLLIALAVRLSSPGPVLFRQRRVGLDGREFDMLKFRTMTGSPEIHGEADAAWVASANCEPIRSGDRTSAPPADRRTSVGRFLRKCSLDELPQLVNVLRGEMSLVGPRPERVDIARAFEQGVHRYGDRHRMKAGLTGWAQVQGLRGSTSLVDRVEWDNHYVENWSPWFDVKIVLLTVSAVFLDWHR